ncbi:hypothetical protein BCR32DRAFT_241099 [Anaeromyces robustus]|uniref:Uncharacterized protein n=1 Tax=Anaeromyces robustus TaxID=1754192 RepID=A0A1Y1XL94_9FUNG|nr:hypothetical protein BCR32DRAFT_241099 [Anaeromyces robustus]|eukprot:ORX86246.1 hypothetical protein BCR32DRAFT_241099 [Anaeromyces robustus]
MSNVHKNALNRNRQGLQDEARRRRRQRQEDERRRRRQRKEEERRRRQQQNLKKGGSGESEENEKDNDKKETTTTKNRDVEITTSTSSSTFIATSTSSISSSITNVTESRDINTTGNTNNGLIANKDNVRTIDADGISGAPVRGPLQHSKTKHMVRYLPLSTNMIKRYDHTLWKTITKLENRLGDISGDKYYNALVEAANGIESSDLRFSESK